MYEIGMLCKHFKGATLLEKNIYRIEAIGVEGTEIDESAITYTGEGDLKCLVCGGAYSVNKSYLVKNGFGWFPDEQP